MFGKVFLKEWRENILVFGLAIFMIIALVVLSLSEMRELTLNFSAMFLLLFLPFAALLIGSGGFFSEFKDNAWVYLFSRPIRKEIIWIFKYVSLLSILLVIFGIFFLVKHFLPGLDEILKEINFPNQYRGLLLFSIYFVTPLLAFTISFSISILYERQFIILFVAILLGAGLAILFRGYIGFLWATYSYYGEFRGFAIIIALSFILASILTLVKSDFSQMRKKILTFTKYVLIFLVISFVMGTVWISKGNPFSGVKRFYASRAIKHNGNIYIDRGYRGIIRYNSIRDKVEKLGGKNKYQLGFSIGGEKVAFFKYKKEARRAYPDLWVMNTDGSQEKALFDSYKQDSPFHNLKLNGSCLLSPDGRRVIFFTSLRQRKLKKTVVTIWWMNTDGTGLKSQTLDFPMSYTDLKLIAWPESKNYFFMLLEEKSPTFKRLSNKLIRIDLEQKNYQVQIDNVKSSYFIHPFFVSPRQDFMVLVYRDKLENKDILAVLNLKTLEKKEVHKADTLGFYKVKWNANGDKILFSRPKETWVYSIHEDRARRISRRNYNIETGFDWLLDGGRIVLYTPTFEGDYFLKVLGEAFSEEKDVKIPFLAEGRVHVWGLKNKVLVKFQRGPLWRVDLETEKWKKIY
jgi:hypothetical protein